MDTLGRYRRWLLGATILLAVVNIVSALVCDLREWLVYFDPIPVRFGVLPAFLIGLPALTFLAPTDGRSSSATAVIFWLLVVTIMLLVFESLWWFQIIVATFFRGPDWNFYWPWEDRIPKFFPFSTRDLSEYFWVFFLQHSPRPRNLLTREVPGFALVGCHFVLLPILGLFVLRRAAVQTPAWRLLLFAVTFQLLSFILLKITLRWLFNLKYIIFWPEPWLNL